MSVELNNICMSCMKDKGESDICPHCGYSENEGQLASALPFRHILQGRYMIGKAIDSNGEGIGYMGYDTLAKSTIYIREYMPNNLCFRDSDGINIVAAKGSELSFTENEGNFLKYNRRLASMRSLSALIPIFDIFSQNGTNYTVSEWSESISLKEYIDKSGGRIDWEAARRLFMPILSTLIELKRAGINHLGINPENLIIFQSGKMKIRGFCIPEIRRKDSDLKPEIFDGCASLEQYTHGAEVGECTDVYGFAANVFFSLTGKLPVCATKRRSDGRLYVAADVLRTIPPYVTTALASALKVDPNYRTASLERLRDELNASPTINFSLESIKDKENEMKKEKKQEKSIQKQSKYVITLFVLVIAVMAGLALVLFYQFVSMNKKKVSDSSSFTNSQSISINDTNAYSETSNKTTGATNSKTKDAAITAPDLKNKDYQKAKKDVQITRNNIELVKKSEVFDENISQGNIISQDPEPGTQLRNGDKITVIVSKGAEMRKLPDVKGKTVEDASRALSLCGMLVKIGKRENNPNVEAGRVIAYEDYKEGSKVRYGSTVKLIISKGQA